MRHPLRRQLLLPLLAIVFAALVGLSLANIALTSQLIRQNVDERMQNVARTLGEGTYPLETNVLKQVRGLSGADLVVRDAHSLQLVATSNPVFANSDVQAGADPAAATRVVDGEAYFVHRAAIDRRPMGGRTFQLEIFYPERLYQEARWQAIYPSLLVGCIALLLAVLLASLVAARVTLPVRSLQQQVQRIAQGDFEPFPAPARDDELRDLALAVNRMAQLLKENAAQIRQHERQATLHQLGAGIAHQLRNAATGCRMALDLFRREHPQSRQHENLVIAARQLELMEHYLQRFLTLGRTARLELKPLAVNPLVDGALVLVRPLADHLHVTLELVEPRTTALVTGDATSLEQVLVNLLTNAIEACAVPSVVHPRVRVQAECVAQGVQIRVADNGPGIAAAVAGRIGEPFVTSKPEGTGLGIAVAKELLSQHGGTLTWERRGEETCFVATLPAAEDASNS